MLSFLTLLCMGLAAYAFVRQGLLTALAMTCNVLLAGLVAFSLWEPLANALEGAFGDSFLRGSEDCLALVVLFCGALGLLRLATNSILKTEVYYHPVVQQGGAAVCGLVAGYLVAGFLTCAAQTLPWGENFLGFSGRVDKDAGGLRRFVPPDRVWLATMRRASLVPFVWGDGEGFDPNGSFELRYERHRRFAEDRDPLPYGGDDLPVRREAAPPK